MERKQLKEVVIIGAGFAGLWALKNLSGGPVRVTIVDRNNYHTFLPLLYQVAAAEIEPEQIAYPVRTLLRGFRNARYLRAEVERIDFQGKFVECGGQKLVYDYLIVACGSVSHHYGIKGAGAHSFGLKTLDEAIILRNHILSCFERASCEVDPETRKALLSFVIIGGGPTGVEFAGALAELVRGPLRKDFPSISREDVSISLVESGKRLLGVFNEKSGAYALARLESMGIKVLLGSSVAEVTHGGIGLAGGITAASRTVVWTAGVSGAPVPGAPAALVNGAGRIESDECLRVKGADSVYIAGDITHFVQEERPLPMVATVAIQQGRHAAKNILRQIGGGRPLPFRFRDKGTMATIGRSSAITRIRGIESRGFVAWVLWLAVHIMYLIGFRNKILVMINWVYDYFFFEKSVRLILPRCCDSPGQAVCLNRERRCPEC